MSWKRNTLGGYRHVQIGTALCVRNSESSLHKYLEQELRIHEILAE